MSKRILYALLPMLIGVAVLSGCGTMGDGIPPEKLGEYAQVVSRIGVRGSNMDTLPKQRIGFEGVAYISWINGKVMFPARDAVNVRPGEYDFQVGLGCDNTATCRPSRAYKLIVKAGYRYVITPEAVYVSDRFTPRNPATETRYSSM